MAFNLSFAKLVEYDSGQTGISLEVRLRLSGREVSVPVKIDTGAIDCVFARRFGEELGLNVESGQLINLVTVTGTFPAYRHEVTLKVLDYEFDVGVCFAADENFSRNVLGRHGFLDRVRLGLIDYDGKLYLSDYHDE
jgi:hypothetical protein